MGFSEEDLEGDFDPEKYDAIMQSAFDDEYYQEEEVAKPEFSDDDEGRVDACGTRADAGCLGVALVSRTSPHSSVSLHCTTEVPSRIMQ